MDWGKTCADYGRGLGMDIKKSEEELQREIYNLRRQMEQEDKWRKELESDRKFGRILFVIFVIIIAWVVIDARTSPPSSDYPPDMFCYDAGPTYYTDIVCE